MSESTLPWDTSGMPGHELKAYEAAWEASGRCADAAPDIPRGSDIGLALKAAYPNWPAFAREHQAEQVAAEKQRAGKTRAA
jgi:hypothetical protein